MELIIGCLILLLGLGVGYFLGKKEREGSVDTQAQFENLANRIFQEKNRDSSENLTNLLNPLRENIQQFQKDFGEKYIKERESGAKLEKELERLFQAQQSLGEEAQNLANALKGSVKAQGNWGEMVLERILESSGLSQGQDYIREGKGLSLSDKNQNAQRPDVIINLPENKHLIIDAKVSLIHYDRYLKSGDDNEKKDFIKSLKSHIQGLGSKDYYNLDKIVSPEFVLLFMPIEGAFSFAIQEAPELYQYAWEKKVIIVSPTTLLATLKTVASVWRIEKQEQNALKIAQQGGRLYDKFVLFLEDLEKVGSSLNRSKEQYDQAFKKLRTGKGNLVGQAEKLKELGAKTSKGIGQEHLEAEESEYLS